MLNITGIKRKRTFKTVILESITVTALLVFVIALFTIDLWPYKTIAAVVAASVWLLLFGYANNVFVVEE